MKTSQLPSFGGELDKRAAKNLAMGQHHQVELHSE